ncbi:hypothetical protein NLI96_g11765 [Meripilus lineatus]|uniref:Uncharacterized protein n=1 Tax=Meripilus lineatus TaxID=2056292 RepID=A0AAD5UR56_9APHY|nr:hypothetical protein NLI96_g11765 [Physisporinus lineatus]
MASEQSPGVEPDSGPLLDAPGTPIPPTPSSPVDSPESVLKKKRTGEPYTFHNAKGQARFAQRQNVAPVEGQYTRFKVRRHLNEPSQISFTLGHPNLGGYQGSKEGSENKGNGGKS